MKGLDGANPDQQRRAHLHLTPPRAPLDSLNDSKSSDDSFKFKQKESIFASLLILFVDRLRPTYSEPHQTTYIPNSRLTRLDPETRESTALCPHSHVNLHNHPRACNPKFQAQADQRREVGSWGPPRLGVLRHRGAPNNDNSYVFQYVKMQTSFYPKMKLGRGTPVSQGREGGGADISDSPGQLDIVMTVVCETH